MKVRLIFIVVILLLLSVLHSCGSSRKAQTRTELVKVETRSHTTDSTAVVKHFLITEADLSLEDMEVTHIIYDTTIRSPAENQRIISKTTIHKHRRNNIKNESRLDSFLTYQRNDAEISVENDSIYINKVKEQKETTVPSQIANMTKWISFLFLLIFLFWLAKRIIQK